MATSGTSLGLVSDSWKVRAVTWIALLTVVLIYPAVRMAVSYLDVSGGAEGREAWWTLWGIIFVGHWICAAIVFAAIKSEGSGPSSVGLDPAGAADGRARSNRFAAGRRAVRAAA